MQAYRLGLMLSPALKYLRYDGSAALPANGLGDQDCVLLDLFMDQSSNLRSHILVFSMRQNGALVTIPIRNFMMYM